jgi:hypothetical protein
VQAYAGAGRMGAVAALGQVQGPVDHRRAGKSSWLEAAKPHAAP